MGGPTSLVGLGAVVTGAGHGIGAALARRLATEGVRVVVNDLDAAAAQRVADEIGGTAAPGDCASEEGVRALLETATDALGRIDLYFANAGLDSVAGDGFADAALDSLATSDAAWQQMHEVNVMAHVRAARALVPGWVAGGGGRFVVTASAAGLLTMLGAAPYSTTKHAAVGFAEWLSATYGHRGVVVQAICPQGVQTRMYEESGPLKELLSRDAVLTPDDVASAWVDSLTDDRFLVLPHPEVGAYYRARAGANEQWLAGMRRLQAHLDQHLDQKQENR
ncbi:SDR family oxidoreductase [Nocardioides gilvus]|uniref:SDR family oxidoreductase n=1 Tax=Nocardioides gilvus TaxID=1735589 RepID=UPI000D74392D|nr:SDR family oxidoreductase [Nocardioides gilvus]